MIILESPGVLFPDSSSLAKHGPLHVVYEVSYMYIMMHIETLVHQLIVVHFSAGFGIPENQKPTDIKIDAVTLYFSPSIVFAYALLALALYMCVLFALVSYIKTFPNHYIGLHTIIWEFL